MVRRQTLLRVGAALTPLGTAGCLGSEDRSGDAEGDGGREEESEGTTEERTTTEPDGEQRNQQNVLAGDKPTPGSQCDRI